MTSVRALVVALVLAFVAAIVALPVAAQEPDPADGGRIVRSALDALDPLDSYRFEITRTSSVTPGADVVFRTVRVNEPEFQAHYLRASGCRA